MTLHSKSGSLWIDQFPSLLFAVIPGDEPGSQPIVLNPVHCCAREIVGNPETHESVYAETFGLVGFRQPHPTHAIPVFPPDARMAVDIDNGDRRFFSSPMGIGQRDVQGYQRSWMGKNLRAGEVKRLSENRPLGERKEILGQVGG